MTLTLSTSGFVNCAYLFIRYSDLKGHTIEEVGSDSPWFYWGLKTLLRGQNGKNALSTIGFEPLTFLT